MNLINNLFNNFNNIYKIDKGGIETRERGPIRRERALKVYVIECTLCFRYKYIDLQSGFGIHGISKWDSRI